MPRVLYSQPIIPPTIFSPLIEGCLKGLDAFRFFFKQPIQYRESSIKQSPILYKSFVLMRGSLGNT